MERNGRGRGVASTPVRPTSLLSGLQGSPAWLKFQLQHLLITCLISPRIKSPRVAGGLCDSSSRSTPSHQEVEKRGRGWEESQGQGLEK